MNEREKIIRLWFDMWIKKADLGIDNIFTDDVVYTENSPIFHYLTNHHMLSCKICIAFVLFQIHIPLLKPNKSSSHSARMLSNELNKRIRSKNKPYCFSSDSLSFSTSVVSQKYGSVGIL